MELLRGTFQVVRHTRSGHSSPSPCDTAAPVSSRRAGIRSPAQPRPDSQANPRTLCRYEEVGNSLQVQVPVPSVRPHPPLPAEHIKAPHPQLHPWSFHPGPIPGDIPKKLNPTRACCLVLATSTCTVRPALPDLLQIEPNHLLIPLSCYLYSSSLPSYEPEKSVFCGSFWSTNTKARTTESISILGGARYPSH